MNTTGTLKGRFSKLDGKRQAHLNRCRACSELTIPAILPADGKTENDALPTPYQGAGARCVNNLSAKLLLALLPPNSPFFRLKLDPKVIRELTEAMGESDFKTKIEAGMASTEQDISDFVEMLALRVPAFRLMRNLVVTGNAMMVLPDEGGMKVHRLDQYVVRRDPMGDVLEAIIKEGIAQDSVPESVLAKVPERARGAKDDLKDLELYTRVWRDGKMMRVTQEVSGVPMPETEGSWPIEKCPYHPLTWTRIDGENYGRGHVEEYLGDFISLESLSKSIVEASAGAAKVLFLLDPNSVTTKKELNRTPNMGFAIGRKDDVTVLQLDKYADFQIAFNTIQKIEDRLEAAFLLHGSVQRAGERVTATEIQYMIRELEDALGGIYSVLSQEFQLVLVRRLMAVMTKKGLLPRMPAAVHPTITTGLEALGRGHDLAKLEAFLGHIQPLGPDVVKMWVKVGNYITRVGTAVGLNTDGLVATIEEIKAEQEQQKQEQMMMELGKPAVGPIAGAMAKQMGEAQNG